MAKFLNKIKKKFYFKILLTESWLAAKEAFVSQYDLGDSVDSVDLLIRKHETFTQALLTQSGRIEQLKAEASILDTSTQHNEVDADRIRDKYEEILRRHENLLENCNSKRRHLEEARKLQVRKFSLYCNYLNFF